MAEERFQKRNIERMSRERHAPAHYVSCMNCGKQFDTRYGYVYIQKSKRYVCPECATAIQRQYEHKAKGAAIVGIILLVVAVAFIILYAIKGSGIGLAIAAAVFSVEQLFVYAKNQGVVNMYSIKKTNMPVDQK